MRNADLLGLVRDQLFIEVSKGGEGLLAPARLAAQDDLALLVAAQQGLDLQHRADDGSSLAHAPAALEIGEVVDREILAHHVAALRNFLHDLVKGRAVFEHACSLDHEQPLAERGGISVDGGNLPLREFFLQLLHSEGGSMCRAADAAGHADVDCIISGRKRLTQRLEKTGDVDHGGRHGCTAAHCVIVSLAVKVHSRVLMRLDTADQVGQRNHAQGIFLNV